MDATKIEVSLSQDKINFINDIFQKELQYWKEATLKKAFDKDEADRLENLATPSFFLIRKPTKNSKETDINGIREREVKSKRSAFF